MSATRTGGLKVADKLKDKNPDYYIELGKLGGRAKVPKVFALMSPEKRWLASIKGGTTSRKTK